MNQIANEHRVDNLIKVQILIQLQPYSIYSLNLKGKKSKALPRVYYKTFNPLREIQ